MNLDNIKKRIQALSAKTVDNGCTEAEALAAMEKIGSMLAEYNLSMSEVELREESENCIQDCLEIKGKNINNNIGTLLSSISIFTDTKCWIYWNKITVKYIFFGLESDVKSATYLLSVCTSAMINESYKYVKSLNLVGQGKHRSPQNNFQKGFASRIYGRLYEIKQNNKKQQAASTGTALIVLKDQLVKQEYENLSLNLQACSSAKTSYDSDAIQAGQHAANKFNLNNPIENRRNGLLS